MEIRNPNKILILAMVGLILVMT